MKDLIVDRQLPGAEAMNALDKALRDALGSRCAGCSSHADTITVHLTDDFTADDENLAVTIVKNHDFATRTKEQVDEASAKAKVNTAKTAASNIPGWATWDEETALDWITENVNDLSSAKTAIKALARMVVALRDHTWPNLVA